MAEPLYHCSQTLHTERKLGTTTRRSSWFKDANTRSSIRLIRADEKPLCICILPNRAARQNPAHRRALDVFTRTGCVVPSRIKVDVATRTLEGVRHFVSGREKAGGEGRIRAVVTDRTDGAVVVDREDRGCYGVGGEDESVVARVVASRPDCGVPASIIRGVRRSFQEECTWTCWSVGNHVG